MKGINCNSHNRAAKMWLLCSFFIFSFLNFPVALVQASSEKDEICKSPTLTVPETSPVISDEAEYLSYHLAVYYAIPTDISYDQNVYDALVDATLDIQSWYQAATGGLTWKIAFPEIVKVYHCKKNRQYYVDNGDWWGSLPAEMQDEGLPVWSPGTVVAIWAHGAGWWAGAGQSHSKDSGLALLGVESFPQFNNPAYSGGECPGGEGVGAWPCTPLGAYAHELGHTLGLGHPDKDPALSSYAYHSIMQTHWNYPDYASGSDSPWGFLTAERDTLRENPFMHQNISLLQRYPDADIVNLPKRGSAPTANFTVTTHGKTVILENKSSSDATLFYWTFGDGHVSNDFSPTHTYTLNGTYTINLRASNSQSMMGFAEKEINISGDSPGNAATHSPYPLHMPFAPGTSWLVGATGNFYGEGGHTDANNDYYATDWNKIGGDDLGQTVYPVAPGKVVATSYDPFYGNYIDIVHSFEENLRYGVIKTRYAHLNRIDVGRGDIVYINSPIGTVGSTGNSSEPHLHLSFQIFDGTNFISLSGTEPSRQPCPMVAFAGEKNQLWELNSGEARTVAAKQFFNDVPNGFWAKPWIDAVYAWGVMEPYPPGQTSLFNPDVPVTRAYIAKFWVKAYHGPDYVPPAATGAIFDDVPADYWAAPWIEQLYRDGFTKGCSEEPPLYCPEDDVKRSEMAVFILRALHGSDYYPPTPTGHVFNDAPYEYWGTKWIEQLAKEGITSGCSLDPPLFCPENPVTRAEISVFLLRAFGIYPPVVGGHGGPPEEPRTWEAQLTVKDAGDGEAALVFGKSLSATEALDLAFQESELPPLPPSGSFDARFELPNMAGVGTLRDFRPAQQNETTWKIKFQPGPGGYPMTLSWNKDELPLGDVILKDEITGTIINVNMKLQEELTVTNPGIGSLLLEQSSLLARNVESSAGWNLISAPVIAENMRVSSLFPQARSSAFYFNNGYVQTDELNVGTGYWLKFDQPHSYTLIGAKAVNRDITVTKGWNIIGPFETDVFTSEISTTPENIVQTNYYGFDNGYVPVSILRVGKGYWVKVSEDGVLHIPEGGMLAKQSHPAVASTDILSRIQSWPMIRIRDAAGGEAALYLMPRDAKAREGLFELPPIPPRGIFDVRFESNQCAERLDDKRFALKFNGERYPLSIVAKNLGSVELRLESKNRTWSELLKEGKEILVEQKTDHFFLAVKNTSMIPADYELSQNYPNPFNPTTTIKFSLPEATHVKMTLYNAVGAKVADLLDGNMSAGYHTLELDARSYASGIYFYTLETFNFKDVKKMVVLK